MDAQVVSAIATAFIAVATLVNAFFYWQNLQVIKGMNKKDEEYKSSIQDLYQAIVISNLLACGPGALDKSIDAFKTRYRGKVQIWLENLNV